MHLRKKYIGSKAFYASVIALVIPMVIQSGITSFVNLLDNVMVGRLGTQPMSGVAIVNQIIFIFNLTIFGGMSGASISGPNITAKGTWRACGIPCGSGFCLPLPSPEWGLPPCWALAAASSSFI